MLFYIAPLKLTVIRGYGWSTRGSREEGWRPSVGDILCSCPQIFHRILPFQKHLHVPWPSGRKHNQHLQTLILWRQKPLVLQSYPLELSTVDRTEIRNILKHHLFTEVFGLSFLWFPVHSLYLYFLFCPSNCPSRTFIKWCWSWKKLLVIIIIADSPAVLSNQEWTKPFPLVRLIVPCSQIALCLNSLARTAKWKNVYVTVLNFDKNFSF